MYRQRSLLKRSVLPEDIAEAIYFFASDASAKSTGNIVNVDAGNAQSFTQIGSIMPDIAAAAIEADNAPRRKALARNYAALGAQLPTRGIDIEGSRPGSRTSASPSPPGASAPAARASVASPAGPAARHLRQARRLRRHPAADRRDADRLAAYPMGQGRPPRAEPEGEELGLGFDAMNSNTFSDAPDQPLSYKFGCSATPTPLCAPRRSSTTSSASRSARRSAQGPDRLVGDGSNFPGQPLHPRLRALPRRHRADLRRPPGRLADLLRAQDVRAGVLLDGGPGLGHQLHARQGARADRPSASSTSATTRRTSTSR